MIPLGHGAALRPLRVEDAEDVWRCADDLKMAEDLGPNFPHPYTLENAQAFIAHSLGRGEPFQHFAITKADRVVGSMGIVSDLSPNLPFVEVGYWVGAAARGQGLATRALKAYTDYVFAAWPELARVEALIFAHNTASRRVLEKAGFTCEGMLRAHGRDRYGTVHDDLIFARLRG